MFKMVFVLIVLIVAIVALVFKTESKDQSSIDRDTKTEDENLSQSVKLNQGTTTSNVKFEDGFEQVGSIDEASGPEVSTDKYWWVSAGATMLKKNGSAMTNQGPYAEGSFWKITYKKNNPRDTDDGSHPQNIFRLVQRNIWNQYVQQVLFKIRKSNFSISSYRNDSNGLLLFNKYQDEYNLYYTGIRVDGYAVIKKKIKGKYFTLAYNRIFPGEYNREKNPNLLPHDTWLGLRSEVNNVGSDSVSIKLYLDRENNGNWELVAEAVDDGKKYGGKAITKAGHGGIRTDFMDVEFDDYRIEEK